MHARNRSRPGISVIELMVVIVIIAFLIALLIPAVQKVREAAQRTQSINNLKQIAISFHGFHDTRKYLPFNGSDTAVGKVKYSKAAKGDMATSGSWAFQILPYVDQEPLFKKFDTDDKQMRAIVIPVFLSPLRGRVAVETSNGGGAWSDYFLNNYVNAPLKADKPDSANNKRTLVGITDGASNTILAGYGNINTKQYQSSADVTLCSNIYLGGTFGTARGGNAVTEKEPANPGGVTLQRDTDKAPDLGSWGGPMPLGALMCMGDGTVRFFSYTTRNFGAFLTPSGAEEVVVPE
jgi:type II secretory pathway pseudopilin PulG